MKTNQIYTLVISVLALFTFGCASSHYSVIEAPSQPIKQFNTLEIAEFKCNLNDSESNALANSFAGRLYRAIMIEREHHPDESIFEKVVLKTDDTQGVLLLNGTIISFEKGSRAARYFIGFGAGKTYCTIQAVFINKATGEEILKTNFDGELSMGIFGGSHEDAVDAVVDSFIAYFDDYFEKEGLKPTKTEL